MPVNKENDGRRSVQVEVEVPGTPEQVWRAIATAEGIRKIAEAIEKPGGEKAVNLRVAEQYLGEFGNLAKTGNTLIIPSNLSDIGGMVAAATKLLKTVPGESAS